MRLWSLPIHLTSPVAGIGAIARGRRLPNAISASATAEQQTTRAGASARCSPSVRFRPSVVRLADAEGAAYPPESTRVPGDAEMGARARPGGWRN